MSSYYLCDTCAVCKTWSLLCDRGSHGPECRGKKVISDDQTPHEVCKHWKPKETE